MGAGSANSSWLNIIEEYQRTRDDGRLAKHRERRWSRSDEFSEWLKQENLANLSMDQALTLHRAAGGGRAGEFKTNPIEEIRETLDFLLYDTVKLEGRFEECAAGGGGFKLEGAGKEFVSYLLCLQQPGLLAVWNSHAEGTLRRVGAISKGMKTGPLGIRYLDMLEGLAQARYHLGLPDFRALDELCFAVASRRSKPGRAAESASPT